jgi:hypothetical protein
MGGKNAEKTGIRKLPEKYNQHSMKSLVREGLIQVGANPKHKSDWESKPTRAASATRVG